MYNTLLHVHVLYKATLACRAIPMIAHLHVCEYEHRSVIHVHVYIMNGVTDQKMVKL